ncbi:MAG: hypothetical protein ACI97G_000001, partial [Porticoccaceae bacterium]
VQNRIYNISLKKLPSLEEHKSFVENNPYSIRVSEGFFIPTQ